MKKFKGRKYKKGTDTWTRKYDAWRTKHGLCNSPMAYACMMKGK